MMQREQRTRAMRARFGVGGGVETNAGGAGGEQNNVKDISLVSKRLQLRNWRPASGSWRAARSSSRRIRAGRDESASADVVRGDADSAGAPPQRQQH
eukprot:2094598-Prymnesium_polylepis.1